MHVGLGEFEVDLVGGKLLVSVGQGGGLVLHHLLVEGVKEDSFVNLTVEGHTGATSNNR